MDRLLRLVLPGLLVVAAAAAVLWVVAGAATPAERIDRGQDVVWVVGALLLVPLTSAVLTMYYEWSAARRDRSGADRGVGAS
ncbi:MULTISPECIES: hypothetical protein [Pseudonocardia]|uniref:Uncharacterized protein n=2 Tax=Pseudonocardia TaxID=1847 RepID=A0A1Y2MY95_PSEAH|nr:MULTISPECIES: hypothetical protein [Pseudonocardia]OSY39588.1 hypothetical protein BG845_03185 [Pseudonocardia autotrophica]TDN72719.1 hypothetical protein C8E95_1782 [Pseudonocardia autotrophica]BBG03433.1 hypothetical protein Pdca_46420 [Pseudonocardia autotrophica]GEC24853.1 hypothetical protein PSA01_18820 [Pseudonocardia saturnea]